MLKQPVDRAVIAKLAAGEITVDEAAEELAQVRREVYCRVSAKKGVSVYGLGRLPTTLYVNQWEALIRFLPTLKEFITDHRDELICKGLPMSGEVSAFAQSSEIGVS